MALRKISEVQGECDPNCVICDGEGWVCENHHDKPWGGMSNRPDACDCGAGEPCVCNPLHHDGKTKH